MTDQQPNEATETVDTDATATEQVPTVEELQAQLETARKDADKYKGLMRSEESKKKDALKELDGYKQASMTDAEKALAEAEARGRQAAQAEFEAERTKFKIQAAAKEAGVPDEVLSLIDPNKLLVDGEVNRDILSSLAGPKKRFEKSASDLGIGAQNGTAGQITRDQLRGMTHAQINKARAEGRLDALMKGQA